MNRKLFSVIILFVAAVLLLSLSNCARNQHLVSISISPSAFTYGGAAPPGAIQTPIPLTAYGTYIHTSARNQGHHQPGNLGV
jgi:hypothetical protein